MTKKRFVVLLDESTTQERDSITKWLRESPLGFWHHFVHAYLVTDASGTWTPSSLREKFHELAPSASILVVSVPEDGAANWSGRGPTKMFDWLKATWPITKG